MWWSNKSERKLVLNWKTDEFDESIKFGVSFNFLFGQSFCINIGYRFGERDVKTIIVYKVSFTEGSKSVLFLRGLVCNESTIKLGVASKPMGKTLLVQAKMCQKKTHFLKDFISLLLLRAFQGILSIPRLKKGIFGFRKVRYFLSISSIPRMLGFPN